MLSEYKGPERREQWYTNKELFEMIQTWKDDVKELRQEMRETKAMIHQYNDLKTKLLQAQERIYTLEQDAFAQDTISSFLRRWGGWIVAAIMTIITAVKIIYDIYIMVTP